MSATPAHMDEGKDLATRGAQNARATGLDATRGAEPTPRSEDVPPAAAAQVDAPAHAAPVSPASAGAAPIHATPVAPGDTDPRASVIVVSTTADAASVSPADAAAAPAYAASASPAEMGDEGTHVEPVMSPGHAAVNVANREDSHTQTGSSTRLSWGARTDVGLVREHNEDSYLVQAPVFAVCDGMGGHAAGEVASAIAVAHIAESAPPHADDVLLGASVEGANIAVMEGAATGQGKPGMGCTASCAVIEDSRMAIAHVGDSRIYLLHAGTLVRLTHDHSYVEELVEAGEITADEARVHPSRSVITRALGSDPDMYADHFTIDVSTGDRIIICSDGLSSMIEDSEIEALSVSSASPQAAADNLVAAALTAGGHDNVSVVVIDVLDDGLADAHRRRRRRTLAGAGVALVATLALLAGIALAFVRHSWYVGINGTTVGIYRGVVGTFLGMPLSTLVDATSVEVGDLPEAVRKALAEGVRVSSEAEAVATVDSYREQIDADKSSAAETAERAVEGTDVDPADPATPDPADTTAGEQGDATPSEAAPDATQGEQGEGAPDATQGGE